MNALVRLNHRIAQLALGRHVPRRTVRVRLTLLYGALFLLSGAGLLGISYVLFQQATNYTKPQLPQIPHTPAIHDRQLLPQLTQVQRQLARDQHDLVLLVPKGMTGHPPGTLGLPRPLAQRQRQLLGEQHQLGHAVDQLATAVHQMTQVGSVQAAQRAADSHQLLVNSGLALAIVALLALLGGWFVAGRMLRPIRTITRKAQRISSMSLHERLALDGPQDELKELADTLDNLLERLDAAFEAQRQFVANASHELRAPLTRQRALIEVALASSESNPASLRATHERVLVAEQHLEQIIDGLLTLTRGQAGPERHEPLDLADLASQAMLARETELAALELDCRATLEPAPTTGDPRLIERLIANLIDNAIRHNNPGGYVDIMTTVRDRRAVVSIGNTGPTVPPEEIQRLFQPFQRLNGSRTNQTSGHGLGLAIVQAIAIAHHAELTTCPRPQGGLTIEVSFAEAITVTPPIAAPARPRIPQPHRENPSTVNNRATVGGSNSRGV